MNGSGNWRASLSRDAPQRLPGAGRAAAQTFNFDASPGLRMLLELISAPLYEQERRSRGRRGKQGERDLRATKLPPAGRGKPTVENGTALRPRDKLLAGHAVDLRRWRVLWLQHCKPELQKASQNTRISTRTSSRADVRSAAIDANEVECVRCKETACDALFCCLSATALCLLA